MGFKVADLKRFGNHSWRFGWTAEKMATMFLRFKGYRILSRNQRYIAEVDILATQGKTLILVEVKARSTRQEAHHALTTLQKDRLIKAAQTLQKRYPQATIRHDALLCFPHFPFIEHVKDAFCQA